MHQISTRVATEPFLAKLFAYCPTMDLVATVTRKDGVDVWRLNGQRVFGATFAREGDHDDVGEVEKTSGDQEIVENVKAVAWRRDGELSLSLRRSLFDAALDAAFARFHLTASCYRQAKQRDASKLTTMS